MRTSNSRRRFLGTAVSAGTAISLEGMGFLRQLPRVSADEAKLDSRLVRLSSDIEPLVRLIETSSRETLLETVAAKIRSGTSYREVLAALLLAGVRNIQPRPAVGFKFHSVLVVNAAHMASLSSPDSDRWLPIFWALDYFKATQLEEEKASGWKLGPVKESQVPTASKARVAFVSAMDRWDVEAADAAVTGLVRSAGSQEIVELLYRFGVRDYRAIGHKAIYVANSWRTLQCIGWQYAEPVLRSLAFAILNHENDPNPATADLAVDRPWRRNLELAKSIRVDWQDGKLDSDATRDFLGTLRSGSPDDAADQAIALLNRGTSPQSLWDAVLVGSGELLMRQPAIIGLHTLTTANALHYAYSASSDDMTRRLMLLQNVSFMPLFRKAAENRGALKSIRVDNVPTIAPTNLPTVDTVADIFVDVSSDREQAAAKIRGFLASGGDARQIMDAARRLVFQKGTDAHDYKFSAAVLEDYAHISPAWRDLFLSLSVFNLKGSKDRDNRLVERVRSALT